MDRLGSQTFQLKGILVTFNPLLPTLEYEQYKHLKIVEGSEKLSENKQDKEVTCEQMQDDLTFDLAVVTLTSKILSGHVYETVQCRMFILGRDTG